MLETLTGKSNVNFYGDVESFFLKYVYVYQLHNLIQICSTDCNLNGNLIISENSGILNFGKLKNNQIEIVTDLSYKCFNCKKRVTCEVQLINNPNFLFMEPTSRLNFNQTPKTFQIQNKRFKLQKGSFVQLENIIIIY